jgi:hypothetical protein
MNDVSLLKRLIRLTPTDDWNFKHGRDNQRTKREREVPKKSTQPEL